MYRVGICSDKRKNQSNVVNSLLKASIETDLDFQIKLFSSGESFLDYYRSEGENIHFAIVDTGIEDVRSVDLVKNIRNVYDSDLRTIIMAESVDNVISNLEIQPFRYVLNPINYGIFRQKVVEVCKDIDRAEDEYVLINSDGEDLLLKQSDIILIESAKELSSSGKLEVETREGRYIAKGRLSNYAEKLRSHSFLQIHRSYLVNLDYVNKIKSKSVVLKDERELPIGRTKAKDVKAAYSRFVL